MSTVAAIVVTYDRPLEVLARALNSVLIQSRPADEVVVVYTGGDVNRLRDIEQYASSLGHDIRVVHTTSPASGAEGRNLGSSLVKSDYLAFLDDDDVWYSDKLESQMSCVHESPALVVSPYDVIETDGSEERFVRFNRFSESVAILGENIVGSTSFPLVSKTAFDTECGFDKTFRSNQEWDLWIRIIMSGGDVRLCDVPAGIKNESLESITSSSSKRMAGFASIFRKHWRAMLKNPRQGSEAAYYWWTGAYKYHCPLNTIFALSLFLIFKFQTLFKSNAE